MKGNDAKARFEAEIEEANRRRDEFHRELKARREIESGDGILISGIIDNNSFKDCSFNVVPEDACGQLGFHLQRYE